MPSPDGNCSPAHFYLPSAAFAAFSAGTNITSRVRAQYANQKAKADRHYATEVRILGEPSVEGLMSRELKLPLLVLAPGEAVISDRSLFFAGGLAGGGLFVLLRGALGFGLFL